ncbi:MAG TPA: metallophosphoesterase [Terriglobales bacterium]
MALSRRDFIKVSAAAAAAGGASLLGVGLHEPHETVVNRIPVVLDRLPEAFNGFRVAQLSDIHFNSFMTPDYLRNVVALISAEKPDMVMYTGDFVSAHGPRRKQEIDSTGQCVSILRQLAPPLGSFAVLGNHDSDVGADIMTEVIASAGIPVLRNQSHAIERDGARLQLVGVDNVTAGHARVGKSFRGIPNGDCCLVAVHEPDIADEVRKLPADFQMSGHSHGGQIRMPGVGAVVLPPFARKYPKGAYQLGALRLYTNSGIGVIGMPVRFLCPPEISIFEFRTPGAKG